VAVAERAHDLQHEVSLLRPELATREEVRQQAFRDPPRFGSESRSEKVKEIPLPGQRNVEARCMLIRR
jgi:hypothetical protein